MSANYDIDVVVNMLTSAGAVQRTDFGVPFHAANDCSFAERYRLYTKGEYSDDSELGTEGKAACAAHFAQTNHTKQIGIGRVEDDEAQSENFEIGGTWAENDVAEIEVTPDGASSAITGTFTCGAAETPKPW